MTKSDLFKAAHKIARETKAIAGSYRIAFACALKDLYAGIAAAEAKSVAQILEDCGCQHWERGEMDRIYINRNAREVIKAAGFKQLSSGKFENASGGWMTSGSMTSICTNAFYDCKAQEWNFSRCGGSFNFEAAKNLWINAFAA